MTIEQLQQFRSSGNDVYGWSLDEYTDLINSPMQVGSLQNNTQGTNSQPLYRAKSVRRLQISTSIVHVQASADVAIMGPNVNNDFINTNSKKFFWGWVDHSFRVGTTEVLFASREISAENFQTTPSGAPNPNVAWRREYFKDVSPPAPFVLYPNDTPAPILFNRWMVRDTSNPVSITTWQYFHNFRGVIIEAS